MSASRTRSSTDRSTPLAIPTLAVTEITRPSIPNGDRRTSASRSASALAGIDRRSGVDEDHELVAAEPAQQVLAPDGVGHTAGDGDEQLVAGRVPHAVVEGLEVVEVDEQHAHRHAVPVRDREEPFGAVDEQGAVREPGERIVEGLLEQSVSSWRRSVTSRPFTMMPAMWGSWRQLVETISRMRTSCWAETNLMVSVIVAPGSRSSSTNRLVTRPVVGVKE